MYYFKMAFQCMAKEKVSDVQTAVFYRKRISIGLPLISEMK